MPLIKDHAFIEWLVTPPSAEDMRRSPYNIRVGEMQKLEAMWKENPDATLDGACVCVCFYYIFFSVLSYDCILHYCNSINL